MPTADGSRDQATVRPSWLAQVINAAEEWHRKNGGGDGGSGSGRPARIGPVVPDPERPGWFCLSLRRRKVDSDRLEEAFLAPAEGSKEVRYSIRDSVQDGDRLRVLVMAGAPAEGLFLWAPARDREALAKALIERLSAVGADGVHAAFGRRRLDPVTPCRADPPGLDPDQRRAFEACVSPGLNLVWGPPGTGKTEVIARAAEYLVRNGKSVLLVSGTNVAVDNALERTAKRVLGADEHGVMVRVGTPHVLGVANDPRISLAALRAQRQQAKENERAAVEDQIMALRDDPAIRGLAEAEERLAGFDPEAYEKARERLANGQRLDEITARCARAQEEREQRRNALAQAEARLRMVEERWADTTPQRAALSEAQKLREELDGHRLARARAVARLRDAELQAEAVDREAASVPRSLRARARRREAAERVEAARAAVVAAAAALDDRHAVVQTAEPAITQRIRQAQAKAGSLTREQADRLAARLNECQKQLATAERALAAAEQRGVDLGTELLSAGSAPQPTAEDHAVLARADKDRLPELHQRLPRLRAQAGELVRQIDSLTRRHERLVKELRELGRDAERAILAEARLVATTLAMLRLKPAVHGRAYDVVIVDEAAASTLPELVHAVSLARQGAVLLGDFMQNAPIIDGLEESRNPVVRTWLATDCFAFFGVTDAKSVAGGCVALSRQRRFGPAIAELANQVAYGGMLRTESRHESRVVFVDVDGLGDEYVKIRKQVGGTGNWWIIGALLARAITEYHVAVHGERGAGVVTPYRVQKETIEAMLADAGASELIEVSTSHGFQGREFDTIVFDLVEDGRGWVAGGTRDGTPFQLSGLRLFNVAVTRARANLYLIGNGAALGTATTGPLHAIKQLIDRGLIEVVEARTVLGMPEPQVRSGTVFELWDAVRTYVKVVGIFDEDVVPDQLIERIAQARSSIWIWSPWVANRVEDFLPELRAAQARGVEVRVMTMPKAEVSGPLHPYVDKLRRQLGHVVFVKKEHQKLVIIDERLTFIGSMNVLSHPHGARGRREVMTLIESADFAKRMLRHERADEFARPPSCSVCGATMRVAALSGSGSKRGWHWWCYNPGSDGTPCKNQRPFSPNPAGRNQQRSQNRRASARPRSTK